MSLTLYERVGHEGRRPSPFSWRARYALAHKGLEAEFVPVRFAQVEEIRALSGQHMVPVLVDGETVVPDSWAIAAHLEDRFPDRPTLFGDATARAMMHFLNTWTDQVLMPSLRPLIYADFPAVLDPGDRAYFRETREAMVGASLEDFCADRAAHEASFVAVIAPFTEVLSARDHLCGTSPAYADYIVFSAFQMARLGSPTDVLSPGDPVFAWRARMIALFDGMADLFPGHPAAASAS